MKLGQLFLTIFSAYSMARQLNNNRDELSLLPVSNPNDYMPLPSCFFTGLSDLQSQYSLEALKMDMPNLEWDNILIADQQYKDIVLSRAKDIFKKGNADEKQIEESISYILNSVLGRQALSLNRIGFYRAAILVDLEWEMSKLKDIQEMKERCVVSDKGKYHRIESFPELAKAFEEACIVDDEHFADMKYIFDTGLDCIIIYAHTSEFEEFIKMNTGKTAPQNVLAYTDRVNPAMSSTDELFPIIALNMQGILRYCEENDVKPGDYLPTVFNHEANHAKQLILNAREKKVFFRPTEIDGMNVFLVVDEDGNPLKGDSLDAEPNPEGISSAQLEADLKCCINNLREANTENPRVYPADDKSSSPDELATKQAKERLEKEGNSEGLAQIVGDFSAEDLRKNCPGIYNMLYGSLENKDMRGCKKVPSSSFKPTEQEVVINTDSTQTYSYK